MISGLHNFRIALLWSASLIAIVLSAVCFFVFGVAERAASARFARVVERDVAPPGSAAVDQRRGIPIGTIGCVLAVVAWEAWISLKHVPQIVAPSPAGVASHFFHHPGPYV